MAALKNLLERKWNRRSAALLFVILFALGVGANVFRFSKDVSYTFKSNVWSDRAGYYIYLPSALLYNMDGREFPDSSEILMGHGFNIQEEKFTPSIPQVWLIFNCPFI